MYFPKCLLALPFLVGQSAALLATFDQANINLNNYMSASFPGFRVVRYDYEGDPGITPASGNQYVVAQSSGNLNANGTLQLNTHSTYGHLNNFYLACYTPATFVPESNPCNFTMVATCANKAGKLTNFTLAQQYTRGDNKMDLISLAGFYQYYANLGYFTGNGSAARCPKYFFQATPTKPGNDQFAAGFFLDSMNYTVTTTT